jgi:hypothetical protein
MADTETTKQIKPSFDKEISGHTFESTDGPTSTVELVDNKGTIIGKLEDVTLERLGLISKMDEISLDGRDYKIVSRLLDLGTKNSDLCLTLRTSHASTVKPVKNKKTGKWEIPKK